MRRFLITALLFAGCACFASEDLSKQATAFYSDNNYNKKDIRKSSKRGNMHELGYSLRFVNNIQIYLTK